MTQIFLCSSFFLSIYVYVCSHLKQKQPPTNLYSPVEMNIHTQRDVMATYGWKNVNEKRKKSVLEGCLYSF